MNRIFLLMVLGIAISFTACDSGKQLAKTQQTAQQAYNNGDYATALNLWEGVIADYEQKDNKKQCPVYTEAGMAAQKLGQTDKAINYLKQANWSEFSKEETYLTLAEIYREKDNLSLELVNLETYLEKFPQGAGRSGVNKRLFELYVESDNFEKAINMWGNLLPEQQSEIELLQGYLAVNDKVDNDTACFEISNKILDLDENNEAALKWLSNYYFWKAEKRYQAEMKAYEKHKTRKQYKILLKALDEVTVDYKKSLNYALRLYKLNPEPKTAKLLSKCYTRLDNKKKAAYYKKLAGK